MASGNIFTPGSCATVTAGSSALSITVPAAYSGTDHQLQVQVKAGADAAFSLTGTAEAPDGTPDLKAVTLRGGNIALWTIPATVTSISYIRVGGTDATVDFTWGMGA